MKKRGQATGATMLILILLALFLVYAVVTDPEEFSSILSGNASGSFKHYTIGTLREGMQDNTPKDLPTVTLETLSRTETIARLPDILASNGIFSRTNAKHTFRLSFPETTDDVYIGFTVKEHKGTLSITINDKTVFTGSIETPNPQPIKIPKTYLATDNTITFSTESGFLGSANYKLTDITIIGTLQDRSPLTKKNTLTITQQEAETLKSGTLMYTPLCEQNSTKKIIIQLNTKTVTNQTPTCNEETTLQLSHDAFKKGANTVTYTAETPLRIDQQKLLLNYQEGRQFTTTYQLSTLPTYLGLEILLSSTGTKEFTIKHNNNERAITTTEQVITVDVTNTSRTGTNTLELLPRGVLTIPTLRIIKR